VSIIRTKGDMDALALRSGGSTIIEEESVMSEEPNAAVGESIKITMDSFNESGERVSRIVAEWFGMENEEANIFGMTIANAVFDVVDGFREVKNTEEPVVENEEEAREYDPNDYPPGFNR